MLTSTPLKNFSPNITKVEISGNAISFKKKSSSIFLWRSYKDLAAEMMKKNILKKSAMAESLPLKTKNRNSNSSINTVGETKPKRKKK